MGKSIPSPRRFWSFVKVLENGCWEWQGVLNRYGYGHFQADGYYLAHRWAFEHFLADIPEGEQIDHLCQYRACVNPAHMECVSLRANLLRGKRRNQYVAAKNCRNGHEYTPENTFFGTHPNGREYRICRICYRGREERARERLREKRHADPTYGRPNGSEEKTR